MEGASVGEHYVEFTRDSGTALTHSWETGTYTIPELLEDTTTQPPEMESKIMAFLTLFFPRPTLTLALILTAAMVTAIGSEPGTLQVKT